MEEKEITWNVNPLRPLSGFRNTIRIVLERLPHGIVKWLCCYIAKVKNNSAIQQYNNFKPQRGFTLVELLVASAIIGVLVSSAFFFLDPAEQLKKSHDSQRKNDLEQVRIALDAYYNDNNRYPTVTEVSWGNSWVPYMAKISKDPLPNQNYLYEVSFDRSSYRLYAKLERCSDPQIITGIDCATASYNYSVTSSNTSVIPFGAPTPTP